MARRILIAGSVFGFLSVAFGAFGAHALESRIDAHSLEVFRTGVQYQSVHALALVLIGVLLIQFPLERLLKTAGVLFVLGIVIFSGFLYALAVTGIRVFGAIVPIGGACFLAGWACAIVWAWRLKF